MSGADVTPTYEGRVVAGKFRLERVLGEGGMGIVYAAVHLDLVKHVAIKIIRDEYVAREDIVERMLNEARSAAKLRSEHVAHVLDVGQLESGAPYIVMDYLDGCDLAVLLSECGRLSPEDAALYLLQASEAVAEAHSIGIVHRDLKPDNLFLSTRADGEPLVKVLDFGISKPLADANATGPGLVIGSPDYMSPEAVRGAVPTAATDIWSLGAVLYELVTGVRPFDAPTLKETWGRILHEKPVSPRALVPELSPEIEAVILRALAKDPADRFASVAELAAALAPCGAEGSADLAKRVARVAAAVRWQPRSTLSNAPLVRVDIPLPQRRDSAPATSVTSTPRPMMTSPAPKRRFFMVGLAVASVLAASSLALLLQKKTAQNAAAVSENAIMTSRRDASLDEPLASASPAASAAAPVEAEQASQPGRKPAQAPSKTRAPGKHRKAGAKSTAPAEEATPGDEEAAAAPVPGEEPTGAVPGSKAPGDAAPPPAAPAPPTTDPYDSDSFGGRQ